MTERKFSGNNPVTRYTQPKSLEELLSEKLSDARVRNHIKRVAGGVKILSRAKEASIEETLQGWITGWYLVVYGG